MNVKSGITLAALVMGSFVGFTAAPASAQEYAGTCTLSATGTVTPGGTIQVSGSGFEPNIVSNLTFSDADSSAVLGLVTAGATGTFGPSAFTLPSSIQGSVTLSAICEADFPAQPGATVLGVVIVAPTTTSAAALPRTGTDSSEPLAAAGAVSVALGAATVLIARRRRSATA